ncbi:hypothetical protein GH714_028626 [Hevea brasiliensis]|uniref:NLE domain-containing protein n=1 Tax=Hevea brasiliensis TaxID=3981 RepID=A0A6A6M181_HEVBR|nr:hypothetical protein GH714_028626 [Hevea brasiliensis]
MDMETVNNVMCQLTDREGTALEAPLYLPQDAGPQQLQQIVNELLRNEEKLPYSFYISDEELLVPLETYLQKNKGPQTMDYCYLLGTGPLECPMSSGHGNRVNSMTLSTDYVLRTGAFDHTGKIYSSPEEMKKVALERYNKMKGNGPERLVSGSDDSTLFLWEPAVSEHHKTHMTAVNHVYFSPDGQWVASASFDGSVKLWNGVTGKFVAAFRGHVGRVYQISVPTGSLGNKWHSVSKFSLFSFLFKFSEYVIMFSEVVWDIRTRKLKQDLPGHADEVYAIDWSPDGEKVASGGKDGH